MILNLVSGHLWWGDCFIVTHQISDEERRGPRKRPPTGLLPAAVGKAALHGSTFAKPTGRQVPTALSALHLAIRQTPYRYPSYFFPISFKHPEGIGRRTCLEQNC